MALNPALQVRRIKAAIALAGLTQKQFSERIEILGVNKSALGLMVRADKDPPPQQSIPPMDYATAVCMGKVAGVPPEWFMEPDLSKLFCPERSDALSDLVAGLADGLDPTAGPAREAPDEAEGE